MLLPLVPDARAQGPFGPPPFGGPGTGGGPPPGLGSGLGPAASVGLPGRLPELILNIINFALILVAVLALAYLVYGGFRYMTAAGNEDQINEAKRTLTYAIVGIVVIGVAAAVVNFVVLAVLSGGV